MMDPVLSCGYFTSKVSGAEKESRFGIGAISDRG